VLNCFRFPPCTIEVRRRISEALHIEVADLFGLDLSNPKT